MPDFNLSAEISLQLAKGAVAKLKSDIESGTKDLPSLPVNLKIGNLVTTVKKRITAAQDAVNLTPIKATFDINHLTPLAKRRIANAQKIVDKNPIKVSLTFEDSTPTDQVEKIKKAIKPIPIDVKFDRKSVRDNISTEKLLEIMGARKVKVSVEADFDKASAKKLNDMAKTINKLTKESEKLQAAIDKAKASSSSSKSTGPVSVTPISGAKGSKTKIPTVNEDATEDIKDVIQRTKDLNKLNREVFGKSNAYGGGFYAFAKKEIDALKKELLSLDPLLQRKIQPVGKITGSSLIAAKFSGLNEESKGNFQQSLKIMFSTLTKLEDKEKELIATEKKVGTGFDTSKAKASIASVREEISKLFLSLASGDPATFSTSVSSEFSRANQSVNEFVRSSTRGLRDYERLLTSLELKQKTADLGNAGPQVKQNIKNLIDEVKSQKGKDVDAIKNSDAFKDKNALLGHLKYVDQEAKKAEASIDSLNRKMSLGELKKTELGKYFDIETQTKAIGARAAKGIAGANDPNEIKKFTDIAKQEANALQTRVSDLTRQYKRLTTQAEIFESIGYQKGADSLRNFTTEFLRLANAGNSIESIDNTVTRTIANATNTKGLDAKIERTIQKIQRLRDTIESSGSTDISGVGKQLKDFEDSLTGRTGKFSGLTASSLDKGAATSFFDIRGAQRMNDMIDTISSKMKHIGKFSDNLGIEEIYTKGAVEFEKGANSIVNNGDRVGKKIKDLKALGENVLAKAKFDSEGGFFGSIAKSAGLAAKRLGAFLILAQGLYTIQSFFTSALQEAVELDKQFVRLEQVFNKDLTGSALVSSLGEVQAKILNLGKTLGVTSIEVANAAQVLAQAGIKGKGLIDLLDVVAKSELGPSFGSATETAEASIAIMNQFGLSIEKTTEAIGGINRISAKYAVEAKGITEAVRRAGGVFATSGDNVDSFAAAFTIVKEQTREADESIATGLRNVAQRLQSSTIQEKLKAALGVDLVKNDAFVGFEESIRRIGIALKDLKAGENSPLFSKIREIIGGQRQGGRVTPLLQNYEKFGTYVKEFGLGAQSIEEDATVALNSITNKIERAKGAIKELYTEFIRSDFVKFLVEGFTQITVFATGLLRTLNSVPGAIFAIGTAAKILGNSKFVAQTFLGQIAPRVALPFQKNNGGHIPGGGPNKDSLLGALTPGEFVLKRKAVQENGVGALNALNNGTIKLNTGMIGRNKGGVIPGYNTGGLIGLLKAAGFNLKKEDLAGLVSNFKIGPLDNGARGSSSARNKSIQISNPKQIDTLAHEFGHILTSLLDKSTIVKVLKDLPQELKDATKSRVQSAPKIYGREGTTKYKNALERETVADAVKELAGRSRKSVRSIGNRNEGNAGFNLLESAIQEKTGISIKQRKKSVQIPSGYSGPNLEESKEDILKRLGGNKSKISDVISKSSSTSTITPQLPIKAFGDLSKSVLSTRGVLIALTTGLFAVQGVLGQFSGGLSELVTAMASAAFSMYTFAKAGQAIGFAKNALGVGAKAVKGATGKAVAAQFASGNGARVAAANAYKASRVILPGTGPTLDTASIIAKVRSAPRLPSPIGAGGRSAGALANSALAKQGTTSTLSSTVKALTGSAKGYAVSLKTAIGGFNLAAIAVGLFTGAMSYFVSSMETAGREGAVTAKTLEEARSAASKRRFGESTKGGVALLGKVAAGAAVGGSAGSAVPVIGTAIGAIIGGLAAGLLHFSDDIAAMFKNNLPAIYEFGKSIKDGISYLFGGVSDYFFTLKENLKGGSVTDTLLTLGGAGSYTYGGKILESQKKKDDLDFRTRQIARRFDSDKNSKKPQQFTNENLQDIKDQGLYGIGLLKGVREKKGQDFNFADFAEEDQTKIKDSLQLVADTYAAASPKNKELILAAYAQEGEDLKSRAAEVGIKIDAAGDDLKHAFDELSLFFAKMTSVVELSSARLSGLEGGLAHFSDPSKQNFAPDQLFDILKSGIDPSKLGLGNTFNAGANRAGALANQFDPRLLAAGNFEIQGRRAARNTAIAINTGPAPQLRKADGGGIDDFLSQAFSAGNGGNSNLDEAFGKFIASKSDEDKSKIVDAGGIINGNEINSLFKEFADTFQTGALEEIKRINTISKQFADEYKSQLAQRFALEGEAIGLLQSNVEKRKSIDEIGNKARVLTGDALAGAQRGQAAASDNQRLGLALKGTGLGGNAGVGQLQGALLASQQRQRNAGAIAQQGGGGAAAVVKREAEIQAIEAERQNRLKAGLQLIASGTDSATFAMNEFERASQKAAASSKYLSDALLGSDDQMHQTILGIQAMAKIQEAYNKGGVGAAQQMLSTFSEEARQALQGRAGASEENQAAFNRAIGISSNIQAGPEAAAAQGAVQQQMEANNALVAGINNNIVALTTNTTNMEKFYAAQFANTQQIVQQAEASAKALVGQIANLPQTIKHEGNVNVNITGAAGLETLQKGISDYVQQMINRDIEKLTNKLVENNAGLNRP